MGEKNQVYNINGDTAAGAIAKSLKSRRLILMTNTEPVSGFQFSLSGLTITGAEGGVAVCRGYQIW